LPEKYRGPLVLCNLLNRTQEQAARELGLERSALGKRLKRAYTLLRQRLLGRGISLSLVLLASLLHQEGKASSLAPHLLLRTIRAALGTASGSVAALAAPAAGGLLLGATKKVVALALLVLLAGGFWAVQARKTPPERAVAPAPLPSPPAPPPKPHRPERPLLPAGEYVELGGKVLGPDGRPVPGAQVAVCGLRSFRPGKRNVRDEVLSCGQTDEAGRFRLTVPRPAVAWSLRSAFMHLWAAAPGFAPGTVRLPWRPDSPAVEVRLTRPEPIRGRLLGDDDRPAAHVRLVVSRIGDVHLEPIQTPDRERQKGPPLWPAAVITDAEGRFTLPGLDLDRGVGLRICDERFALRRVALEPALWRDRAHTLHLAHARLLEGRIAAEGGAAQPGARLSVLAFDAAGRPFGPALDARADAAGAFHVRLPAADHYRVEAFAPEGNPFVGIARDVAWPEEATRQQLELTLPRGFLVRGVVADADSGKPVPQAHVQFWPRHGSAIPPDVLTGSNNLTIGGPDGAFQLAVPEADGFLLVHEPSGEYVTEEWTGRLQGFAGRLHAQRVLPLVLAGGPAVRDLAVLLRRGVSIHGRVLGPEGKPVPAGAWLCRGRTCPDKADEGQPQPFWDGRFTLPGCVPGRLYPVLFLDARRCLGARVDLLAGGDRPVDVRLQPCGTAEVRFLDAHGQAVAGHQPFLYVMAPPDRATEDGDGREPAPAEMHELDEFDPGHYRDGPRTDAAGRVALPALIPGVRHRMSGYLDAGGAWREFETRQGQKLSLPDVVLPRRP
jgi:hypothetical protein